MPRNSSAAGKLKATKSEGVEPDMNALTSQSSVPTTDNTSKSDNVLTTKQDEDPTPSDALPPSSTNTRSKRKLAAEQPASESLSNTSFNKKSRHSKGYAPPSTYAHLKGLTDTITPNLLCLFIGLNPGIQT